MVIDGVMSNLLGGRDIIDLRIRREATVDEALHNLRRRSRHRTVLLNEIEVELDILRQNQKTENADTHLWRCKSGYKSHFQLKKHGSLFEMRGWSVVGFMEFGFRKQLQNFRSSYG